MSNHIIDVIVVLICLPLSVAILLGALADMLFLNFNFLSLTFLLIGIILLIPFKLCFNAINDRYKYLRFLGNIKYYKIEIGIVTKISLIMSNDGHLPVQYIYWQLGDKHGRSPVLSADTLSSVKVGSGVHIATARSNGKADIFLGF